MWFRSETSPTKADVLKAWYPAWALKVALLSGRAEEEEVRLLEWALTRKIGASLSFTSRLPARRPVPTVMCL